MALEEGRRKEVELNFTKEKRQAMEEAIFTFKSSKELRDIKVAFTQEAYIKGYNLCQLRVAKKFLKLKLDFWSGKSSEDEIELSLSEATILDAAADPTMSAPLSSKGTLRPMLH